MTRLWLPCVGLMISSACFGQKDPQFGFLAKEIAVQEQSLQVSLKGDPGKGAGEFGMAAALRRLAAEKEVAQKIANASPGERAEIRTLFHGVRDNKPEPGMLDRLRSVSNTLLGENWADRLLPALPGFNRSNPGIAEYTYLDKAFLRQLQQASHVDPGAPGSTPALRRMALGEDGPLMEFLMFPEELDAADPLRNIARSVVALTNTYPNPVGNLRGTGFCMKDGRIISAAHVLLGTEGWKNGSKRLENSYVAVVAPSGIPGVRTPSYKMFEIDPKTIRQAARRDLVEFRVRSTKDANGQLLTINQFCGDGLEEDANSQMKVFERVSALGFGERAMLPVILKNGITMAKPSSVAVNEKQECPIPYLGHGLEGMSGGPLLRASSMKVVGVIVWQPYRDSRKETVPANEESSRCAELFANLSVKPAASPLAAAGTQMNRAR